MQYHKQILENGITLLKVPIKGAESVLVNFFVKTGSRNEAAKRRGISHFSEHLLFKGTKKYPNAKILSSTVEAIGADYNAATSKEYTVFYIKAASKYLPLAFDVLSDMLLHPKLDPAEIKREKGVIIEEMNMYRDTPMRYISDILEELMWPGSDLGEQIIGNENTVSSLSRADISAYIASRYVNPNLILAVAGKYDEKLLERLVRRYWGEGREGQKNEFSSAPKKTRSTKVKLHFKKTEQAHLALGFYGFDYNHPQVYALDVLCNILGGGMSSRLFSEIRERRGLAYYVRAGQIHYQDTGAAVITAGLRLKKLEEALSVTVAELNKIRAQKVSAAELKKAKENLKGRLTLSLEDSEDKLEWYLEQLAFHSEILEPKKAFQKIDAVSPTQLQKLAHQLFRKEAFKLAVIGPYKGKEKRFEKLIKI